MRVTVCELPNEREAFAESWSALVAHVARTGSALVVLPEMPFSRWLAAHPRVDAEAWKLAVQEHASWIARLEELGAEVVVTTRPIVDGEERFNEAIVWEREAGPRDITHRKQYLPDEEGYWEAHWYQPGPPDTQIVETNAGKLGFAICTEMWFFERIRRYGQQGMQILACPRATPNASVDRWLVAGRTAAIVSGAYCLSSNLSGRTKTNHWGGAAFITEPEGGKILARTDEKHPFATVEIDLGEADRAKGTYPRYVVG